MSSDMTYIIVGNSAVFPTVNGDVTNLRALQRFLREPILVVSEFQSFCLACLFNVDIYTIQRFQVIYDLQLALDLNVISQHQHVNNLVTEGSKSDLIYIS
jgi:hypothetical protein